MNSVDRFARRWAFGLSTLMIATWRLWWPVGDEYPLVGWIQLPGDGNASAACLGSLIVAAGLLIVFASGRTRRCRRLRSAGWWGVAVGLMMGFVVDQHRLQPWAYQSAIYATVFATMSPRNSRRWLIPLAASIYLYSAIGKLDYQFVHTVGQQFLSAMAEPLGGIPPEWSGQFRARMALLMPTTECLIGVALLLPRTRRFAGIAAIALHLTLIAILGPWSLGHSTGVLIWNGLLAIQAWFLFAAPVTWASVPAKDRDGGEGTLRMAFTSSIAKLLVLTAIVMPVFERWSFWDHWLSWSLYSPHTSRVEVEFHRSVLSRLPSSTESHWDDDDDHDGWHRLSLTDWSLQTRGVPIYPQSRYQLELSRRLAALAGVDQEVRVITKGVSDRWTGARNERRLIGLKELSERSTMLESGF